MVPCMLTRPWDLAGTLAERSCKVATWEMVPSPGSSVGSGGGGKPWRSCVRGKHGGSHALLPISQVFELGRAYETSKIYTVVPAVIWMLESIRRALVDVDGGSMNRAYLVKASFPPACQCMLFFRPSCFCGEDRVLLKSPWLEYIIEGTGVSRASVIGPSAIDASNGLLT